MGWLSNFFSNPAQTMWDTMSMIPGSPEAVLQSVVDGSGSDGLSWNPFYQEGPSVWDRGALGYKLSEDDTERQHGRMFGRAAAAYGTGGYSEMALAPAEVKAHGGSNMDALKAAGKAYVMAGANSYLNGLDVGGYAGLENPTLRGAANGAFSSATTSAVAGGDSDQISRSAVKGGAYGGLQGYTQSQISDDLPGSYTARDADGELIASRDTTPGFIPTAQGGVPMDTSMNTEREQVSENPFMSYLDRALGSFKTTDGQWNGRKIGGFAEGLMGLYGGYQQRRMANEMMRGMGGRRSAYEDNLRRELLRKDAQAGRRSNYGAREVALQGGLAQLDAQQMPAIAQMKNSSLGGLFTMLKSGASLGSSMGYFDNPQIKTAGIGGVQPLPQTSIYEPQASLGGDTANPYSLSMGNRNKKIFGGQ